jgi:hypothetical protein
MLYADAMPETIYNLFAYTDGLRIHAIGIHPYKIAGEVSDESKLSFLKERCFTDHVSAYQTRIVSPVITLAEFTAKHRLGTALHLFEELFVHFEASATPLFVMTTIVNGEPTVDHSYSGRLDPNDVNGPGVMADYLLEYSTADSIDLIRMFDDDYFKAIKLLFNNGMLVSSTKLLMIFVDTVAFVEHGDEPGNFVAWLKTYVPLSPLNLEPQELWELRNGVLHMSNLHSRSVLSGKVKRLVPCINLGDTQVDELRAEKRFDLLRLIAALSTGVGTWIQTYNDDRSKFEKFIERYDTVIADSRLAYSTAT